MGGTFAQGVVTEYSTDSGTTWNVIPDVGDYELPAEDAEDIDATSHSSTGGRKEYVAGLIDSEEITLPINYDNTNTHHNWFRDNIGSAVDMRTTWKDGATTEFSAQNKGFGRSLPVNGLYGGSIRLKKSGVFTETAAV